jgi:hypothetical protein
MFKANVFPVDLAELVTLCATVADCDLVSADYASYAFGFVLDRGLKLDGSAACTRYHPYLFTKDDSVLPFDSVSWGPG